MANSLIIYAASGDVQMIVHDAADPHDPAWNPPGCVQVQMPRADYDKCLDDLTLLVATQPLVVKVNPAVAVAVQTKIDTIKAVAQTILDANAQALVVGDPVVVGPA